MKKIRTQEDYLREGIGDYFSAYHLLKRFSLPYNKWEQYKTGVIDDKGNINYELINKNPALADTLSFFDKIVLGVKKIISKFLNKKTLTIGILYKLFSDKHLFEDKFIINDVLNSMGYDSINENLNSITDREIMANYSLISEEIEKIMEI